MIVNNVEVHYGGIKIVSRGVIVSGLEVLCGGMKLSIWNIYE